MFYSAAARLSAQLYPVIYMVSTLPNRALPKSADGLELLTSELYRFQLYPVFVCPKSFYERLILATLPGDIIVYY